jgi:hypothetical protein
VVVVVMMMMIIIIIMATKMMTLTIKIKRSEARSNPHLQCLFAR